MHAQNSTGGQAPEPTVIWADGTTGEPDIAAMLACRHAADEAAQTADEAQPDGKARQWAERLETFFTLSPDSLDKAYVALADVTEAYVTAKLNAEAYELSLKVAKAEAWDTVTADCRNDASRDRAMTVAFREGDWALAELKRTESLAKLEVELAKIEVERNKVLWMVQTGLQL